MSAFADGLSPAVRRWLVTVCTMTATIMQALDSTVANVSLPYMQGSLSASLDQINWVLTSYIVAAAKLRSRNSSKRTNGSSVVSECAKK